MKEARPKKKHTYCMRSIYIKLLEMPINTMVLESRSVVTSGQGMERRRKEVLQRGMRNLLGQ